MISRRDVVKAGFAGSAALGLAAFRPRSAWAQELTSLQIFVPAAPGGGWDQTGRTIEFAMRTDGIVKTFKFEHAPGPAAPSACRSSSRPRRGRATR